MSVRRLVAVAGAVGIVNVLVGLLQILSSDFAWGVPLVIGGSVGTVVCSGVWWLLACEHVWRPEGFADWRCVRCGKWR